MSNDFPPPFALRLLHATSRLRLTVQRARDAHAVWRTLNDHPLRQAIADSPAAQAALVYERANLTEYVMLLIRMFDPPGRFKKAETILDQRRISFPVCRDLLALPNALNLLLNRAAQWPGESELNRDAVAAAYVAYGRRLEGLNNEKPNRLRIIRDFRDENFAHELVPDDITKPQYDQLHGILGEATFLIEHLATVVNGATLVWPDEADLVDSATWMWDKIAASDG